ncbi:histidine--tRNA ligase, partial [Striga asiatica]
FKTSKLFSFPKCSGILPVKLFIDRSISTKPNEPVTGGIEPENLFENKPAGIGPSIPFSDKSNFVRLDNFSKLTGIPPTTFAFFIQKTSNLVNLPNSGGMAAGVKRLNARPSVSRFSRFEISTGPKLLEVPDGRRNIAGKAVSAEIEVPERLQPADSRRNSPREVVLREVEILELREVQNRRGEFSGKVIEAKIKNCEALEAGHGVRDAAAEIEVVEDEGGDGAAGGGALDSRPVAVGRRVVPGLEQAMGVAPLGFEAQQGGSLGAVGL